MHLKQKANLLGTLSEEGGAAFQAVGVVSLCKGLHPDTSSQNVILICLCENLKSIIMLLSNTRLGRQWVFRNSLALYSSLGIIKIKI